MIFAVAAMPRSYALPQVIGGNGYLAVYLCGIIMEIPGFRKTESNACV